MRRAGQLAVHHRAAAIGCKEAMWYENLRSIEVYVQTEEGDWYRCRINRSALKGYIERTDLTRVQK